jgi:hypothetical protein
MEFNSFIDLMNQAKMALESGLGEHSSIKDLVNFLSGTTRNTGTTTASSWGLDIARIENEALMARDPNYNSQDSLVIRELDRSLVDIHKHRDILQNKLNE